MPDELDYGKLNKRIVFTENDHRHAKLINRLRYDGLTQSNFFRSIISGYIDGDERIQDFIDELKTHSKARKQKSKKLRNKGKQTLKDLALSEEQVDDLFDLIAEEFPEL